MTFSDWASIGSGLIAIAAFLYSFLSNRQEQRARKFELSSIHRKEVLKWYADTIEILSVLNKNTQDLPQEERRSLLSSLSAKIEIGRFLFPNNKDGYGSNKLTAYQGKRNVILDCLVFIYELNMESDYAKYQQHTTVLQKMFTSYVFDHLDPEKYITEAERNANVTAKEKVAIEDVIGSEPDDLNALIEFGIRRDSLSNPYFTHTNISGVNVEDET